MPHQCVKCGELYPDGNKVLLEGCTCGGKFFFYIKPKNVVEEQKAQEVVKTLTEEEKLKMEQDVKEIIGQKDVEPVVLDIETIRVEKPGKYELDVVDLVKGEPVIYHIGEGKYYIDLANSFKNKEFKVHEEKNKKPKKEKAKKETLKENVKKENKEILEKIENGDNKVEVKKEI